MCAIPVKIAICFFFRENADCSRIFGKVLFRGFEFNFCFGDSKKFIKMPQSCFVYDLVFRFRFIIIYHLNFNFMHFFLSDYPSGFFLPRAMEVMLGLQWVVEREGRLGAVRQNVQWT